MNIDLKNGTYYLSGRLDEYSDFSALFQSEPPLKLNIGKVASINSVGVRKFLAFTLAWSPRQFEFYECTPEFIANVNVIPQMLGASNDATQIKSLYVPFSCESCKRVENVLFKREEITFNASGVPVIRAYHCSRCGQALDLDVEHTEYFMFMRG